MSGLLLAQRRGALSQGASGPAYLLRDLFTTAEAAPLTSPRTCEPGPGTLALTDVVTGADASISGGKYLLPRPTGAQLYGSYGAISVASFIRAAGLTAYAVAQHSNLSGIEPIAFRSLASLGQGTLAFVLEAPTGLRITAGTQGVVVGVVAVNTDYQVAIVLRGSGALFLIRGGIYTDWTLLWVAQLRPASPVWVQASNYNADAKYNELAVLQKTGALADDYGKALALNVIPEVGDSAVGEADCLIYETWTPSAGETCSIEFRRASATDLYRLDCDQAAGTIKLYRRVAGADTELDAGKTQTWTVDSQYRIGITCDGGAIRTFTEATTPALTAKHSVSGETHNLTETGVRVAAGTNIANLEVWPRTFDGTDLETLA